MKMARVGVLFDQQFARKRWEDGENVFARYLGEILAYVGIPFEWLYHPDELSRYDYVLIALASEDEITGKKIMEYIQNGGRVIAYGGLPQLMKVLGCKVDDEIPRGYAYLPPEMCEIPLRFLGAIPWQLIDSKFVARETGYLGDCMDSIDIGKRALIHFEIGKGSLDRWTIDIPTTIVGLQQGTKPVIEDGIPSNDGTAAIDDGILKADDGFELDWVQDRKMTETGIPYFPYPYADLWKEVLVHHLLKRVTENGYTLPFLDYWPEGVEQVAMISHDSDLNVDESAEIALAVLDLCEIQSTWCMIAPGYSPSIYEKVKEKGHELAFHYNALPKDGGEWSEEAFASQLAWMKSATRVERVISNKNHYTRIEGWGELFRWCEKYQIEVDQSRGPSKKGNIGFLFGTCHPYFPIAWADEQNRLYDVLEVGFLTQDLNHHTLADTSVIQPFLTGVKRVRGVAHFLFHQIHILQQLPVREAILEVVREAKQQGFTFWTSQQINAWVRTRRKAKIYGLNEDHSVIVCQDSEHPDGAVPSKHEIVVWVPIPNQQKEITEDDTVSMRFGVCCRKQIIQQGVIQ